MNQEPYIYVAPELFCPGCRATGPMPLKPGFQPKECWNDCDFCLSKCHSYLTRFCQDPHQDTPPYPTAFWLGAACRYSATWVMSCQGLQNYTALSQQQPAHNSTLIHQQLLPAALANGSALLLNHEPGLLLIDNSEHQQL